MEEDDPSTWIIQAGGLSEHDLLTCECNEQVIEVNRFFHSLSVDFWSVNQLPVNLLT